MYHELTLIGRCSKEPDMRYTPDGKAVSNFNMAVDDGFGENKKTIWFSVSAWEKTAENVNQYLKKGDKVSVIGHLKHDNGNPRVWESNGKTGASFEVTASKVIFLADKKSEPEGSF